LLADEAYSMLINMKPGRLADRSTGMIVLGKILKEHTTTFEKKTSSKTKDVSNKMER